MKGDTLVVFGEVLDVFHACVVSLFDLSFDVYYFVMFKIFLPPRIRKCVVEADGVGMMFTLIHDGHGDETDIVVSTLEQLKSDPSSRKVNLEQIGG